MKKLISVVLALVMMMSVVCITPSAATSNFVVKADRASYLQGEQVTARIYLPAPLNTVASLDMSLEYDTTKLEIVSVTDGADLKKAIDAQTNGKVYSEYHKIAGVVNWSLAATTNFDFRGTFATVVFNIRNSAPAGNCTLKLRIKSAANSGYVDMTKSIVTQDATFEIIKVAANELVYELTADKKAYEVIAYHCATIDNITIPEKYASLPVIGIAENAFVNHGELKTIVLPETIQYIGDNAFAGCSGVKELVIPDSVETIGEAAFSGCSNLAKVTLPVGLEKVEKNTFSNCYFLENVEIPFTVKSVETGAFKNCLSLAAVKISRNTAIAADAFESCDDNLVFKSTEGCTALETYVDTYFKTAKIEKIKDFSLGTATINGTQQQYTGSAIKPKVTVKLTDGSTVTERRDYKVVYKNNVNKGTAKVYVAGLGDNGEGYIAEFTIDCKHNFANKEIVKAATCTKTGTARYTCTICGDTKEESIPAAGHVPGEWVYDVRPTIDKTGTKHKECTVCHTVVENATAAKAFPDLNGDKRINSTDALIVLQYSTGSANYLQTMELIINADTNGDGSINSSDALTILLISVGQLKIDGYTA